MSAWEEIKGSSPIAAAESNDCAVVALAAACRVPYDEAWVALDKAGRKPGRGTKWKSILQAIDALGFKLRLVEVEQFIQERYPRGHARVLKSITTHHPERFPGAFRKGEAYLALVSSSTHIAAIVDGVTADWTRGRPFRVTQGNFYRLEMKDE